MAWSGGGSFLLEVSVCLDVNLRDQLQESRDDLVRVLCSKLVQLVDLDGRILLNLGKCGARARRGLQRR